MYKRTSIEWLKHVDFILWDLLSLQIALFVAYCLRHGLQNMYTNSLYANIAIVMTLLDLVVIVFFDSFHNVLKRGYWTEWVETVKQVALVICMTALCFFVMQTGEAVSRIVLGLTALLYFVISYTLRALWKWHLRQYMKSGGKVSLLILTTSDQLDEIRQNFAVHNYKMFHVAGIVVLDQNMIGKRIGKYEVVADSETVISYAKNNWVDEVLLSVENNDQSGLLKNLMNELLEMGIVTHVQIGEVDAEGKKLIVERIGRYNVLTTTINYSDSRQLLAKRFMDILGGLVGCLITCILMIVLAPAIYFTDPGPILFSQTRVEKNGKKFKLYKFRSMYMNAEERKKELLDQNQVGDGKMFKLEHDPRIIGSKLLPDGTYKKGIGNYIRDWSLDEFPQFFNVLKGDMSLVGTRPPLVDEVEQYETRHHVRLAMKPGITGMWQVSGRSKITDFEEVVKLDKQYIENWKFSLDLKILFKTVVTVLGRDGSM